METSAVSCEKEIPYCAICSQSDVNGGILGLPWTVHAGFHATINADRYCSTLSLLRAAIRKKRRGILDIDVIILHDNARPHVANKTVQKLRKFHWEFLEHPPYSPDLAPSDFHFFSLLKKFLAGQRFTCDVVSIAPDIEHEKSDKFCS